MTSLGGTKLGGANPATQPKPAAEPTKPAGSSLGGTALGAPKPAGASLGGTALGAKPAGASLGTNLGAPKPAGASLGGTALGGNQPKPAGSALGGTNLGGAKPAPKVDTPKPEKKPGEESSSSEEDGPADPAAPAAGKKKKPKKKKPAPAAGTTPAAGTAGPAKPGPGAKKPTAKEAAMAAHLKKIREMQEEKERIEREAKEAEERELARIKAEEEAAEQARIAKADAKKARKAEAKIKQDALNAEKRKQEAMAKYGVSADSIAAFNDGGRGRGRGGNQRGGKGRGGGGRGAGRGNGPNKDEAPTPAPQPVVEKVVATPTPEKKPEPVVAAPSADATADAVVDAPPDLGEDWEEWDTPDSKPTEEIASSNDSIPSASTPELSASSDITSSTPATEPGTPELSGSTEVTATTEPAESDANPTKLTREAALQQRKDEAAQQKKDALQQSNLRSPICCVLGHVDTGKTLLLDRIRQTNVQAGEAGGITQQIGATFLPMENIREKTKRLDQAVKKELSYKVPGLLVIDTPGHESFTNLRTRGSSLCDIAILVVDLTAGLEQQTRESLELLKKKQTPFVVALNKVDRCYGWKSTPNMPIKESLKKQEKSTIQEFDERSKFVMTQFAEAGLNACLYYNNKDFKRNVSLVPTSAVTGEGLPDLLLLLIQLSQKLMADKLLKLSKLECTVLEVKKLQGRGTTLDVILANGELNRGDQICICGLNGEAIITNIRAILLPPPMSELRVKNEYVPHDKVRASIGCKIDAPGLDDAVAGSPLFVIKPTDTDDVVDGYRREVSKSLNYLKGKIDKSGTGVYVQTSTLGSMEALLEFLSSPEVSIPVCGIRIGTVHKRDVIKASVMLEHQKEFAVILAFDVPVSKEARAEADKLGVKIFEADIIYHLFDTFTAYVKKLRDSEKEAAIEVAVFPCILRILPECVFRKCSPLVVGVHIVEGIVKLNTPICIPLKIEGKTHMELGTITGIQKDHLDLQEAKAGEDVCIEITQPPEKQQYMIGRHFEPTDLLYSKINRDSVAAMVRYFPEVCERKEIFKLFKKLKKMYGF